MAEPTATDLTRDLTEEEKAHSHPILHRLIREIQNLTEKLQNYQRTEAEKQPGGFTTRKGLAIPDTNERSGQTPVQLSPARTNRNTIVISNTGSNPCYVGEDRRAAAQRGFTVPSGQSLTIQTNQAVFAWAPAASSTTVDILENLYDRA